MKDKIIAAIAEQLDKLTVFSDDFRKIRFEKKLGARTGKDEFCQEIAAEIAENVLAVVETGWEDAPSWAMWQTKDKNGKIDYYSDKPLCREGYTCCWDSLQKRPK